MREKKEIPLQNKIKQNDTNCDRHLKQGKKKSYVIKSANIPNFIST